MSQNYTFVQNGIFYTYSVSNNVGSFAPIPFVSVVNTTVNSSNVSINSSSFSISDVATNATINTTSVALSNSTANIILTIPTVSQISDGVYFLNANGQWSIPTTSLFANTANNALFLNGVPGSSYQLNSTLNANIASYLPVYSGIVNASSVTVGTTFVANATTVELGDSTNNVTVTTTSISVGNSTVFATLNSTSFSQTANDTINFGNHPSSFYATLSGSQTFTGNNTFNGTNTVFGSNVSILNTVIFHGSSSGATTVKSTAVSSGTLTLPAATDTLIGKATTDTLTNKTLDTAGAGNVLKINGVQVSTVNGTGSVVLATSPSLTTPNIGVATATSVMVGSITVNTGINSTAIFIGNSTVSATINSTTFSGISLTANNSAFLGGVAAASYQLNSTLNANIAAFLPTYTGVVNGSSHTVGTTFVANATTVELGDSTNNVTISTTSVLIGNSTVFSTVNSTTFSGTSLTANNSSFLGGVAAASYQLNSTLNANIAAFLPTYTGVVNASSYTIGTTFVANATTLELGTVANNVTVTPTSISIGNSTVFSTANSTVFSGLSLTANNSAFLGGVAAASYQLNSTLNANIAAFLPTYTGVVNGSSYTVGTTFVANATTIELGTVANNVTISLTSVSIGNSTVFSTINSTAFSQTANNATNLNGQAASFYATLSGSQTFTGNNTFNGTNTVFGSNVSILNSVFVHGSTSGTTTLQATATASGTLTLPAATDTLIGKATTDTLTNKTLDTAGAGNVLKINGTQVSAVTGTGSVVLASTPTLTTPNIGVANAASLTSSGNITVNKSAGSITSAQVLSLQEADGVQAALGVFSSNTSSAIYLFRTDGTFSLKSTVLSTDGLGSVNFGGYDGTTNQFTQASIKALATANWVHLSNYETKVQISSTPPSSTAIQVEATFQSGIGVGALTGQGLGTVNATEYFVSGHQIAASDLSNGTTGTGAIVLANGAIFGNASFSTAIFSGSTSGTTTLQASAIASGTLTLPAATDTLIGKATTDVLTNKTYDTAGAGNVLKINGTQVSAVTGTGSVVLATTPTLVTPNIGVATATSVMVGSTTVNTGINSTAIFIGNSTVSATINSTTFSGISLTANNSAFLGGVAAASYQLNSTLSANIAAFLPTYTGVVNASSYTVGTTFVANSTSIIISSTTGNTSLTPSILTLGGFGSAAFVTLQRAGNTQSSPVALTSGSIIGNMSFAGYDGAAYSTSSAAIKAVAAENIAAGHYGGYLSFFTTAIAGSTLTEQVRLQGSGGLTIGNGILATDPGAGGVAMSGNLAVTGTITSGTWNGTLISPTYGGTGVNNGTKTITLGANLVTTGTGAATLAFPSSPFTYTFPFASDTIAVLGTSQTFTGVQNFNITTTIPSSTGAALDDIKVQAATTTITGSTGSPITQLNKVGIYRPTITDSSVVTVTDAATLYVENSPLAAGSVTITKPWAIKVGAGNINFPAGALYDNGTAPTGTGAYVHATSPALVTPDLGVATGTSLALGGAIGNALGLHVTSVNGINSIFTGGARGMRISFDNSFAYVEGTDTTGNASYQPLQIGGSTLTFAIARVSKADFGVSTASKWTFGTDVILSNNLLINGSTSGTTTISASATASGTLTLPAATDTLIGKATTDILTNKTLDTAGTGNVLKINGTQVSAVTGTGTVVLATSPTLVTPVLGVATATSLTSSGNITVNKSAGAITSSQVLSIQEVDGVQTALGVFASNAASAVYLFRTDGTFSAKAAVLSTDGLGAVNFGGYDGTTNQFTQAYIKGIATANWVHLSNYETKVQIASTPASSTATQVEATFQSGLGIGALTGQGLGTVNATEYFVSGAQIAASDLSNGTTGTGAIVLATVSTLSSLASIGTITTGVWNGTLISPTYGGTGVNNGTKTITLGGNLTTTGAATPTLAFGATGFTYTFQGSSDTILGRATTDTLTNKTLDTAGVGNVLKINGTQVSAVTGTGAVVLATSPTITTPVINGVPTGTGIDSNATASTLMLRDSNINVRINNLIENSTSTATAATTTTLTVSSAYTQIFTGVTTQTVVMPVASTLVVGQQWSIINSSTGAVTIQSSGLNNIIILAANTSVVLTCVLASGTSAASWTYQYFGYIATTGKSLSVSNTLTLAGVDGSTLTLGGNLVTSGAFATTLTTTAPTNVTLPPSGTLVNTSVTTLSSLASIGTITTGVWNGTIINPTYGGTGVNNGAKTITLGASISTTGVGAPTLAFPGSTFTYTFQGSSDTILGRATTDTLTNKTLDTAGTGNVLKINGTQVSAVTGTGAVVLASTPTLITPVLGVATATSVDASGTIKASSFNDHTSGQALLYNSGGATHYTEINDGSNNIDLILGGSADPVNYHRNTTHKFQAIGGAGTFATLDSSGLTLSNILNISSGIPSYSVMGNYANTTGALVYMNKPERNAVDFGADPTGVADSATAIQNAINSLPASGGMVVIPHGTYKINSTITIGNGSNTTPSTISGVHIVGVGHASGTGDTTKTNYGIVSGSILTWGGAANTPMIAVNGYLEGWGVDNIQLDGANTASYGLQVTFAAFGQCNSLAIKGCKWSGIFSTTYSSASGLQNVGSTHNSYRDISISVADFANATAITLTGGGGALAITNTCYNQFENILIFLPYTGVNTTYGIYLQICDSNSFHNIHAVGGVATSYPVAFDYTPNSTFPSANHISSIDVTGSASVVSQYLNISSPGVSAIPNFIIGLMDANGSSDPGLAGLSVLMHNSINLDNFKVAINGYVDATGYRTRSGQAGPYGASHYNIQWTGSEADLWVDSSNAGTILLSSGPITGTSADFSGTVKATGYYDHATSGLMLQNFGGANHYTQLVDGSGNAAITAGGTFDPTTYYDNTQHIWRTRAGANTLAQITSSGITTFNSLGGFTTFSPSSNASGFILTAPAATDTIVGKATVDIFTNKTYDTAGVGNVLKINGTQVSAVTGTGAVVLATVSTLSSLASIGTITTGVWNGTVVGSTYGGTGVNNGTKTITLGGNLTTSGAFATTLTVTGLTNVTLPVSGTLVNSTVTTLSSLASIGTITTGTWNGTVVGATYGGTGVNNGAKTITLGASLTTSGAGAPTLAFPASPFTYTFQGSSDTILGRATTDTLTNKTYDTAGTGNVLKINGTGISAVTGTGAVVLATSPTFATSILVGNSSTNSTIGTASLLLQSNVSTALPIIQMRDALQGTDSKMWDNYIGSQVMSFRIINDAYTVANNWLTVTRSGMNVSSISMPNITIPTLASNVNSVTFGSDPGQPGGPFVWNQAPIRMGGTLTLDVNEGNGSADEFLVVMESNQPATVTLVANTSATTAVGNNILHFASVPVGVAAGMVVSNRTNPWSTPLLNVVSSNSTSVTLSGNIAAPGVGIGDQIAMCFDWFKGPLYLGATSYSSAEAWVGHTSNALTVFSQIANGVSKAFAEGVVIMAQSIGTGKGVLISGEFDIWPGDTEVATGQRGGGFADVATHLNLWLGNFSQTVPGDWVIDSGGGAGWLNGISLQKITANGSAFNIPTQTFIDSRNAANSADVHLLYSDSSDVVNIAGGAATGIKTSVPFNANAIIYATGFWDHATSGLMLQNLGGANHYTQLSDGSGSAAVSAGGTFDPTNYYDNTQHIWRTRAGAATLAEITASNFAVWTAGGGYINFSYPSTASNFSLTIPAATDTLIGKATTDILTNKTYDTAGTGNVFKINGTGISAVTGTGAVVLATVATLSSLASIGTITTGVWNGTVVGSTYGGTGVNNGVKTITLGGNLTTSGAFATTLTSTGTTNVTLPVSGTLVNSTVTTLSSLASIGTITTGVWNGTIIAGTYGGTGVNNGAKTITLGASISTTGAGAPTLAFSGSSFTYTFQGSSDTILGRATTDTLTNKTYDTAGAGNVLKINGTQVSAVTGTGAVVLAASPTISNPTLSGLLSYSQAYLNSTITVGTNDPTHTPFWATANINGTGSDPITPAFEFVINDTATNSTGSSGLTGAFVTHTFGGGATGVGNRTALSGLLVQSASTGGNKFYTGLSGQVYSATGDGGTALTPKGDYYGFASIAELQTGATNVNQIVSAELDVSVQTGASTAYKSILSLIAINGDAVRGSAFDAALVFTNDNTTTATWTYLMAIGRQDSKWPMASDSTIFGAITPGTGSMVANNGIDFSNITFSTSSFKSNSFSVSQTGAIVSASLDSTGVVKGSAFADHATGHNLILNSGGLNNYTQLLDGSINVAVYLGGSADPTNYYRNTMHTWGNIGGGVTFAQLFSGGLRLYNSSGGYTLFAPTASASNFTLTLPSATDTLIGKATTDTLTNKTLDTAGTGNVLKINGTQVSAVTGTGAVVLATVGTLSSLASIGTITTGVWNGTVVGATYGGTGVNNGAKTITLGGSLTTTGAATPTLAFGATGYTYTFPTQNDTLAALGTVQTFTNQQSFNIASTVASATGAVLDDINVQAATTTITGNTGTPITKLNKVAIYQPTITDSSVVTVTDAATLYIDNAPLAAGSVTITNAWAIKVGNGNIKLGSQSGLVTTPTKIVFEDAYATAGAANKIQLYTGYGLGISSGTLNIVSGGATNFYAGATNIASLSSGGNLTLKGSLILDGSSSGTTTLSAIAAASGTMTVPSATDTLIGKATTDILTNKTYDTAGTGNVLKINGTQVSAVTGTGSVVLATTPTLTTPNIGAANAASLISSGNITVNKSTGAITSAQALSLQEADGINTNLGVFSSNVSSSIFLYKTDGTFASKTTILSGETIGQLAFGSYDGTSDHFNQASIKGLATANWVHNSNYETKIQILATPASSTTAQVEATFQSGIGVGSLSGQGLGTVNATEYYNNNFPVLQNFGGSNHYTQLLDGSGSAAVTPGGSFDPTNYYDNTQHIWRTRAGANTLAEITSSGLTLFNALGDFTTLTPSAAAANYAVTLPSASDTIAVLSNIGVGRFTTNVNFNAGNTDTPITITYPAGCTRFKITTVHISGASASLASATCGLFTAITGGGVAIISAGTAVTVTATADATNNNTQTVTPVNNSGTQSYQATTIYFRVGTASTAVATAAVTVDVYFLT